MKVILINAVEVYARSPRPDAHHENMRVVKGSAATETSTLLPVGTKYTDFWVTSTCDRDGTKLSYASNTFNGLVTSSLRVDNLNSMASVGGTTSNFGLDISEGASIFLDEQSVKLAALSKRDMERDAVITVMCHWKQRLTTSRHYNKALINCRTHSN
ncbi:hypothetical protein DM01DRAFT_1149927 [Hesseltinella vesiculosa]|uniref:Uncharacterized protein n=1 Tax=Hesseltinella vesiculosa TaxID=101127 RepID=A0A1X2G6T3_9FUNG|nr:hypothetical protein DM01DRAFT_1149927 [Hesseltinella vesiculosa]